MSTSITRFQVAGNLAWYGTSMGINAVSRFVCLMLLWRSLDFREEQNYALLQILVGFFHVTADFGIENAVVRFSREIANALQTALKAVGRITVLLLLPLSCSAGMYWLLARGDFGAAAACLAGYGYAVFQIVAAFQRAKGNARQYAVWNTGRNLLVTAAILGGYFGSDGDLSLTYWFLVQGLVSLGAAPALFLCEGGAKELREGNAVELKAYAAYVVPVFFTNLLVWSEGFIDIAFLSHYHPHTLPPYRLMLDYAVFFSYFGLVINKAWPALYFRISRRTGEAWKVDDQVVRAHFGAGLAVVGMGAAAAPVMTLLAGEARSEASRGVVVLILAANALGVLFYMMRPYLEYTHDTLGILLVFLAAVLVDIGGNALLVPPFQMRGAALSGLATFLVIFWGMLIRTRALGSKRRVAMKCAVQQVVFGMAAAAVVLLQESFMGG